MTLFKDMLGSGESIFKDEEVLDPEFLPKLLPYREQQQHQIASAIKPLFADRNGRNVFISGAPGIGKTAATKWVLRDLEETTDDVVPLFINCWQKNSTYKIFLELCHMLEYKFTPNKNTDELFTVIKNLTNQKSAVFVFDEIDKVEDLDFLYAILNDIEKKTVILITNYANWLTTLEARIRSRLLPEMLEFKEYTKEETKEILKQRLGYAFVPGVWAQDAFEVVANSAGELHDVRAGLFLLRQAGIVAERVGSKRIMQEHAVKAIAMLNEWNPNTIGSLEQDEKLVLELVKEHTGKKIGELFEVYAKKGGQCTYKTFQRRIEKLEKGDLVTTTKTFGGKDGNTTIVTFKQPKLSEF